MFIEQSKSESLLEMATSYVLSKAIYVSVALDIPSLLARKPLTLEELAAATSAEPNALRRLLGYLISHGVFSATIEGQYENNDLSVLLRPDIENSLAHLIRLICDEQYLAFDGLLTSVRTGKPVFAQHFGDDFFTYLAKDTRMKSSFHKAMGLNKQDDLIAEGIAKHIPDRTHLVDVGGGNGNLAISLLRSIPNLTAEVFDRPEQVETTQYLIKKQAVGFRCNVSGGDFFKAVPRGDTIILKRIIHNWAQPDIIKLLSNCRQSLEKDGRLFIIERLLEDECDNKFARFSDLSMLVLHTGRERYLYEYEQLLVSGGFELSNVHNFGIDMVAIEARAKTLGK